MAIASLVSETILSLDGLGIVGDVVVGGLEGKTFGVGARVVFSGCLVIEGAVASPALSAISVGASGAIGSFSSVLARGLGLVGGGWIGGRRAISLEETLGGQA